MKEDNNGNNKSDVNIGDVAARVVRLDDQDSLAEEMREIGVSPEGVNIMAPKGVHRVVRLTGVPLKAAILLKQEMLAKGGEAAVPWDVACLNADRTDMLLMGTLRQYRRVLDSLRSQPFGLPAIAGVIEDALEAWDCRLRHEPVKLRSGGHTLRFGSKTYIMGILNVTPDSFSDGGKYLDPDRAVARARELVEYGADIIDVGGESTRPGSDPVPEEEEIARVIPVVERLVREVPVPISVDTCKSGVARRALEAGAHIINDISALRFDPGLGSLVAQYDVPVILMHMQGMPKDMQVNPHYDDVIREIYDFLRESIKRALDLGVKRENIIIDPGIGFGKTTEHNLEILRRLDEFRSLGRPILVGTSRKSFIGNVLGLPVDQRVEGTAATVALAIARGVDIVRVHDVREMVRVARMADAILREEVLERDER
ncbi:MAG TPA: dihydropteroate synthase [Firmicutes bacterium]|nr:dihydropteroate synthase [Bacillota bacterium]